MKAYRLQDTALRYFLEVVHSGSISVASQRLNVASSAISRQIAGLEELLETTLFERRPRGMIPSPAGEVLAAHARQTALDAARVISDIQALQGMQRGHVRVASTEGYAIDFLPQAITGFQRLYPGVSFNIRVLAPAEVSRRVRDGDADLGLTFSGPVEKEIKVEHRQPAPVRAVMRPGHPLQAHPQITLQQLLAYPLALPEDDNTVRQLFELACSQQQLLVEPALTSNYIETVHNYLRDTDAVSLSAEVSVRRRLTEGTMIAIPIRDRILQKRNTELQTLVGRTLPRAVTVFLEHVKQCLKLASRPA
jgi:DNA-binding transcriptional LysR family regulator